MLDRMPITLMVWFLNDKAPTNRWSSGGWPYNNIMTLKVFRTPIRTYINFSSNDLGFHGGMFL